MFSLSDSSLTDVFRTFDSTSRYLDDLLGIDGPCFGQMVDRMCSAGLQLGGRVLLVLKLRFGAWACP